MIYRFESVVLDLAMFDLVRDEQAVAIEPRVFEVLAYLVKHRDRLVTRTELLDEIWGDRFVTDSALASSIAAARAAIGDDGKSQRLIRTVFGRGLRFIGEVEEDNSPVAVAPPLPQDAHTPQRIQFATASDGSQIAIALGGDGPNLVKAANWLTHVEQDTVSPVWKHWIAELSSRYRYVRYDSRGCGLSTRDVTATILSDLETWTTDLETVVDEQNLDRFVLLGMSQGGAPAMAYAAKHPDRVSHLVLLGCYSQGLRRRGPESAAEADVLLEMMRVGWGGKNPAFRAFFTTSFIPDATSEHVRWFNELQEECTTTENALLLEQAFYDHDFSELAAKISVPTIVFHAKDDMAVPYAQGRRLAALIPGAEFVTLESSNHVLLDGEPAWDHFLQKLTEFTAT